MKTLELNRRMLDNVRNKDIGPAGASLREIVINIRGFGADELRSPKPMFFLTVICG